MRRTVLVTTVFGGYSNCSDGAYRMKTAQPFKPDEIETIMPLLLAFMKHRLLAATLERARQSKY